MAQLPWRHVDFNQAHLLTLLKEIDEERGSHEFIQATLRKDGIYRDLHGELQSYRARQQTGAYFVQVAHMLLVMCPYAPAARAALIEFDWDKIGGQAAQWEDKHSLHPCVMRALALRRREQKKNDEAVSYLRRWIELSPESDAYLQLADLYKEAGKTSQWLGTLESYLAGADQRPGAAQVRVTIAEHYMSRKEWRKAKPYADAAAATGVDAAMLCASRCCEGLEDWKNAERWVRLVSERFSPHREEWLKWCKRTGKGDLDAAKRTAERPAPRRD